MEFKIIGNDVPLLDGKEKAMGSAEYVSDLKLPGMLYGKALLSPYPHARIAAIDTAAAKAMPGVLAVLTSADTNQQLFGPLLPDWYIFAKDKVRFIGEEVAAVAAIDEDTAVAAIEKIVVEYEPLPAVFDPNAALTAGAPLVNQWQENNIATTFKIEKGDIAAAELAADLILEEEYYTNQVYQAYLEPVACVAKPEGNRLLMYLPIQIPGRARHTYGKALDLSPDDIRVIKPTVGGAFGAKMEDNWHVICGLLALKTQRPVKMVKSREEDFISGNPRVPMNIRLRMGFKAGGEILFKECRLVANNGARTSHCPPIMSTACYRVDSLYKFNNLKTEGYGVYTNTIPTGCFRGFGNAQMIFALESMMDKAAEKLQIDQIKIRLLNAYHDGDVSVHGWKMNTVGLSECLQKVGAEADWPARKKSAAGRGGKIKRGIGLAATNHVSGNRNFFRPFDGSTALCRVGEDGKMTIFHSESEIGQGQDTAYAIIAAETMGVTMKEVAVAVVDTQIGGFGMGSFSTRGTLMGGNATKLAVEEARAKIMAQAAAMLQTDSADLLIEGGLIRNLNNSGQTIPLAEVCRQYVYTHGGLPVWGQGVYIPDTVLPDPQTKYGNVSPAYPFGAHIAEVEVDTETGQVKVINYWACHDVGRIINKMMLEGQVDGGIGQGVGWGLMEDMITKDGKILNTNFLDYRCPGALDIPKAHLSFVETNDPCGPYGAKGIGEPALNPVTAAIVNAIYNAIGIRFNELPVTAEKILRAIKGQDRESGEG